MWDLDAGDHAAQVRNANVARRLARSGKRRYAPLARAQHPGGSHVVRRTLRALRLLWIHSLAFHSARLAYSFLFLLAMLVAWVMRDFARPLLEKIPCEQAASASMHLHVVLSARDSQRCATPVVSYALAKLNLLSLCHHLRDHARSDWL